MAETTETTETTEATTPKKGKAKGEIPVGTVNNDAMKARVDALKKG